MPIDSDSFLIELNRFFALYVLSNEIYTKNVKNDRILLIYRPPI